jgi:creatinine amidohydrolase/Fe(II)-dependent formamide hydrolase-like protein
MLARHPDLADMSKAAPGGPSEQRGYRTVDMLKSEPYFMIAEFDELSDTGVIGMPEFATSEKGVQFLEAAAQGVVRFLDQFAKWDFQTRPHAPSKS